MASPPTTSRALDRSHSPVPVDKRLILTRKQARQRIIENELRLLVEKQYDVSPCYTRNHSPLSSYDILRDKHLSKHFKKPAYRRHLIEMGLITKKGKVRFLFLGFVLNSTKTLRPKLVLFDHYSL